MWKNNNNLDTFNSIRDLKNFIVYLEDDLWLLLQIQLESNNPRFTENSKRNRSSFVYDCFIVAKNSRTLNRLFRVSFVTNVPQGRCKNWAARLWCAIIEITAPLVPLQMNADAVSLKPAKYTEYLTGYVIACTRSENFVEIMQWNVIRSDCKW